YELTPQEFGHFDRVTCIGVLHHLEEPSKALEHMWSVVAEGGDLCLWCYGREGNERILPLIHLARFIGSRLPIEWTHALARAITTIGWPLLQHMSFRIEYFNHLKTLSKENVESIIFDQMIPRIAHYWTREEMEALVKPLRGLIHIEQVQGNSWHVRIEKKQMLV
ncbi:MAG: methyltransferase domain-containing protein, partial [Deltaproteobacteria bacterium]|nr:methyltransferase domain-containing protein [Deltaproteobacteria bacterium]